MVIPWVVFPSAPVPDAFTPTRLLTIETPLLPLTWIPPLLPEITLPPLPVPPTKVSLTLSKVLRMDPAFDALPAAVPARVTQALKVCLQKDLRQRVSDIHDVRLALEGAFETRATEAASQAAVPTAPLWRRAVPSAASAAAMAALLTGIAWAMWPSAERPVIRSAYRPAETAPLNAEQREGMAVARDGAFVIYKSADTFQIR